MISIDEMISEPILYEVRWEEGLSKYYAFVTKNKLYVHINLTKDFDEYQVYSIKDIGKVYGAASSYNSSSYYVSIYSRYQTDKEITMFTFQRSEEGIKAAEKLILAISKVID